MSATVSVILLSEWVDSDDDSSRVFHSSLIGLLESRGLEATILMDAGCAKSLGGPVGTELLPRLRRQNVGYIAGAGQPRLSSALAPLDWSKGRSTFHSLEHPGFVRVSSLAGQLPVAITLRDWMPQPFGAIADWGSRVYVGPTCPVDNETSPFYLCGRLHLASLGPYWIDLSLHALLDDASIAGVADQFRRRAEQLGPKGGAIVLSMSASQLDGAPPASCERGATGIGSLLDQIRMMPSVSVQSARQVFDRWADVSYEHAVPTDFFQVSASTIARGAIQAIPYELGMLSPAEQLYGITRIWMESLEKGKATRNTTLRTPMGPAESAQTGNAVEGIRAADLPGLLKEFCAAVDKSEQLPPSVQTSAGPIALEDLLPTLAGGFQGDLSAVDLPLVRGRWSNGRVHRDRLAESIEEPAHIDGILGITMRQLWTFKPVLDLVG